MILTFVLSTSCADAKPPGLFKALAAAMDPLNGPRASLDALRAQQPALGPVDGALIFARAVSGVLPLFPPEEGSALLAEADGLIDGGLAADPGRTSELLASRGELHLAANDRAGAEAALRASMEAKATLGALEPLLGLAPAEAPTLCAKTRLAVTSDEVGPLVDTCQRHGDALAWATPADRQTWQVWREDRARREAELAARHAAEEAALAASFSSPTPSPAPTSPAPSRPSVTSVTIRSSCRQTVRVFFGDKPKYGSGTTTTISSNSVSSYSLRPGDMIWLVDEHDEGLSSTSVSGSSQTVEILESCTGFRVR